MSWKELHNGNDISKRITSEGICKTYGVYAEVTSVFAGSLVSKNDLQETYHFVGHECSLQRKHNLSDPACEDICHLIHKKLL